MAETLRGAVLIYLKGFLMGCADSVPGVSGGTIALITGIYSRLISAITSLHPESIFKSLNSLFRGRDNIETHLKFLVILGSGVLTAVLLTLNIIHFMISNYLIITYSFFFGLISASIITLSGEINLDGLKNKSALITGFITAFALSGYSNLALNHGGLTLFISGAVAVTAMVLPGISGSLMLLILGQYEHVTQLVSEFTSSITEIFTAGIIPVLNSVKPLIIFTSGGLIGLFTAARVVEKALEKDRKITMTFLIGMVAGSLRAPLLRITQEASSKNLAWFDIAPEMFLAVLIGAGTITLINQYTEQNF
mgnify:CR=1 FL=1